jgi:hypothetical protein
MGEAAGLERNLLNLFVAAKLAEGERIEFERCHRERVDWRPVLSVPSPATDRLTSPDFGAPVPPRLTETSVHNSY